MYTDVGKVQEGDEDNDKGNGLLVCNSFSRNINKVDTLSYWNFLSLIFYHRYNAKFHEIYVPDQISQPKKRRLNKKGKGNQFKNFKPTVFVQVCILSMSERALART